MESPTNILALTSWPLQSGLIHAYTLPYLEMIGGRIGPGSRISLVTMEARTTGKPSQETEALRLLLSERGIDWMPLPYRPFGALAACLMALNMLRLAIHCTSQDIRAIHAFCTPAGGVGYLLSIALGIPLVLDSYEPHADAMVELGVWKPQGAAFRILHILEHLQSHRARAVIAATASMRSYAESRFGVRFEKFFVKPACVDLERFHRTNSGISPLARSLGLDGKVVCVYAGKLGGIYLDDEVFEIFKAASEHWGPRFRALLLSGDDRTKVRAMCVRVGFDPDHLVHECVPYDKMPDYLAVADFALTPVRPVPTKSHCTPIKNGEYWAMGLPVLITPGISIDSEIIERERIGVVLKDLSRGSYRKAIHEMSELMAGESTEALRTRVRRAAETHRSFTVARPAYDGVYPSILLPKR